MLSVCTIYTYQQTNMLFVTNNANCSSYTHNIKELFCLPKEKSTSTLNLTLMTVIIIRAIKSSQIEGEKKISPIVT